jgi:hypothetical protein
MRNKTGRILMEKYLLIFKETLCEIPQKFGVLGMFKIFLI